MLVVMCMVMIVTVHMVVMVMVVMMVVVVAKPGPAFRLEWRFDRRYFDSQAFQQCLGCRLALNAQPSL
jgi:hypothetical protein